MDRVSKDCRSRIMRSVRRSDTTPEVRLRRLLHHAGFRFRLQGKDLPGRPDLVFPKRRVALFVHGCYWHRHPGCVKTTTPTSNVEFWMTKFQANVARDARDSLRLAELGWRVVVVWECQIADPDDLLGWLRMELLGTT
jgi:DNA mismatch endonuclease (patch repair protein)